MELTLRIPGRPLSANDRQHWRVRAQSIAAVRREGNMEARAQWGPPKPGPGSFPITVVVEETAPRVKPDAAQSAPHVKALVDGICDAGVLPGDDGKVIAAYVFRAPTKGKAGMTITLTDEEICL